jgi:hypothetical protein
MRTYVIAGNWELNAGADDGLSLATGGDGVAPIDAAGEELRKTIGFISTGGSASASYLLVGRLRPSFPHFLPTPRFRPRLRANAGRALGHRRRTQPSRAPSDRSKPREGVASSTRFPVFSPTKTDQSRETVRGPCARRTYVHCFPPHGASCWQMIRAAGSTQAPVEGALH